MGIKLTPWWVLLALDVVLGFIGHFHSTFVLIWLTMEKSTMKKMTVYATMCNTGKHCGWHPPQQEAQLLPPANPMEFQGFPGHPRDKISGTLPWACLWVSSQVDLTGTPLHWGVREPEVWKPPQLATLEVEDQQLCFELLLLASCMFWGCFVGLVVFGFVH